MLIITCPCDHEWVIKTDGAENWSMRLQCEPCPACGRDAGGRIANTAIDPSIMDVLDAIEAWNDRPPSILSWCIMVPKNNVTLALVTIVAELGGQRTEVIAEVDRMAMQITKFWLGHLAPIKTSMRRAPNGSALRGIVADLVLSIGMDVPTVPDWQWWSQAVLMQNSRKGA